MNNFIVAEVSKSYRQLMSADSELLCQKFEKIINFNYKRGYDLHDWKMNTVISGEVHSETIIAVFRRNESRVPEETKAS